MRILSRILVLTVMVLGMSLSASPAHTLSNELPNLKNDGEGVVGAGVEVPVTLDLEKEWEINAKAPSWLALFRLNGKKAELVREFARPDIQAGKLTLPALAAGRYRLQGTFYFCKEGAAAVCVLQSHDRALTAKTGGSKSLEIKLRQP